MVVIMSDSIQIWRTWPWLLDDELSRAFEVSTRSYQKRSGENDRSAAEDSLDF
jgi:hypothetical protein